MKFNNLGQALGTNLTIYTSHSKGLIKTKSQKVLGPNSYICRSYRGKTGGGGGLFEPEFHFELYTRKVCEMFVYKQTETKEYVKN